MSRQAHAPHAHVLTRVVVDAIMCSSYRKVANKVACSCCNDEEGSKGDPSLKSNTAERFVLALARELSVESTEVNTSPLVRLGLDHTAGRQADGRRHTSSCDVTKLMATPLRPKRPLRPIRCR